MSFSIVPGSMLCWCRSVSIFNDFTLLDEFTDIKIGPSKLLVESTDYLAQDIRHTHSRLYSINLFLFRSRTQLSLFLLHRSPLWFPQYERMVMSRAFAPFQARDQHHFSTLITRFSVDVCPVVIPRILLALPGLVPIRARLPVLNWQAS